MEITKMMFYGRLFRWLSASVLNETVFCLSWKVNSLHLHRFCAKGTVCLNIYDLSMRGHIFTATAPDYQEFVIVFLMITCVFTVWSDINKVFEFSSPEIYGTFNRTYLL